MLILSWHVLDRSFYLLVYLDNNLAQGTVCYNISNGCLAVVTVRWPQYLLDLRVHCIWVFMDLRCITKSYTFSEITFFSVCV